MFRQKLKEFLQRLCCIGHQTGSQIFVKVVVLNVMKRRRLSRRVIMKASIWTIIIVLLAFIILYSFVLTFVSRHTHTPYKTLPNNGVHKYRHHSHKVRFQVRYSGSAISLNGNNTPLTYSVTTSNIHRKAVWNVEDYYDMFGSRPQCKNDSLFTVLITSSPDHFDQRREIRKSWCNPSASGHSSNSWQCIFLIGHAQEWDVDYAVDGESNQFNDILRGSYFDSYRNLTYKVIHGMNWSSLSCPTPYSLKTDDDCFVNTKLFHEFLIKYNTKTSRLYVGKIYWQLEKRKVIRQNGSKWAVAFKEYSEESYPPYASGTGYVLSHDVVHGVAEESKYIQPIPNEDAYMGIVVNALGVEPTSSARFTLFSMGLTMCNYLYVFVVHNVKPAQQHEMHNAMLRAPVMCPNDDETTSWT